MELNPFDWTIYLGLDVTHLGHVRATVKKDLATTDSLTSSYIL